MPDYPWTPEGLRLLQEIENEIMQSGGRESVILQIQQSQSFNYHCSKRNCFFCEKMSQVYNNFNGFKEYTIASKATNTEPNTRMKTTKFTYIDIYRKRSQVLTRKSDY